jgi:glycine/D-amino acid oxidase-like deaminating enzyme
MRVVVIGGGVIGLTTAYELVREGAEVVVLDARATGLGASAVNAGWFVPAEAAPARPRDGRADAAVDAAARQPCLHPPLC